MIRDIFVPILRSDSDVAAIAAAIAMAVQQKAHITALVNVENPLPIVSEWSYVGAEINQSLWNEARAAAEMVIKKTRAQLDPANISSEVILHDALNFWGEETAALHARHADMSIMGGPCANDQRGPFELHFKALLLRSGRPVLMVPENASFNPQPQRVVLAWQPTSEASRSLHDALSWLPPTAAIDVLMIDTQHDDKASEPLPGTDISMHLVRHQFQARMVQLSSQGKSVGLSIEQYAQENAAELLIMGGYGHSRFRELILGSTTRDVLTNAKLPIWFAH